MGRYVVKRLGHAALVLVGVTLFSFFLTRMTGDPVRLMAPLDATEEEVELLRTQLGFNRPLHVQFLDYFRGVLVLDFGDSLRHGEPAMLLVFERMPATLSLSFTALLLAVAVAVPIGVVSATRRGGLLDALGTLLALLGQSMPVYWLGILLIIVFGVQLRWLPAGGRTDWTSYILPAVTLAAYTCTSIMRILRSSMLGVLGQDFIRTARAKGLGERTVVYRHALRNALLPVVTVVGLQLGSLLSGSVITETIFAWPGVGRFVVQAIFNRDFFVVQAAVFLFALVIVAINLATDLLYSLLDPRIRYA
ncbi:peptide/nickel transport system permease protein [Symbiobacterium terraclitae]|uniref:Peptide/nickel transport system permease protein n=1 Tax=Symbiobacterium terraclitae TaxID=557451 RepID=A0ABS4JWC0_9FIRM|nr:ABC transporter permease [Symbiobacterium terraclitae]MBP2019275.1 peptide/nickel transport system permease protein [Symbiobacterium terraclitae]